MAWHPGACWSGTGAGFRSRREGLGMVAMGPDRPARQGPGNGAEDRPDVEGRAGDLHRGALRDEVRENVAPDDGPEDIGDTLQTRHRPLDGSLLVRADRPCN